MIPELKLDTKGLRTEDEKAAARKNNVQAMYRIPRIDPTKQVPGNGNGAQSNGAEQLTQIANQSIVNGKHPVTVLQEVCLKRKWNQPVYTMVNEDGPAHKRHFLMKCTLNQVDYVPSFSSPNKVSVSHLLSGDRFVTDH